MWYSITLRTSTLDQGKYELEVQEIKPFKTINKPTPTPTPTPTTKVNVYFSNCECMHLKRKVYLTTCMNVVKKMFHGECIHLKGEI